MVEGSRSISGTQLMGDLWSGIVLFCIWSFDVIPSYVPISYLYGCVCKGPLSIGKMMPGWWWRRLETIPTWHLASTIGNCLEIWQWGAVAELSSMLSDLSFVVADRKGIGQQVLHLCTARMRVWDAYIYCTRAWGICNACKDMYAQVWACACTRL
jgi:hypothetical protein